MYISQSVLFYPSTSLITGPVLPLSDIVIVYLACISDDTAIKITLRTSAQIISAQITSPQSTSAQSTSAQITSARFYASLIVN